MKKLLKLGCLLCVLVISFGVGSITAFGGNTKITVDGTPVEFTDALPYIDENNRTLVPLRPIAEALGLEVTWDKATKSATFSKDVSNDPVNLFGFKFYSVVFQVGSNIGYVNQTSSDGKVNGMPFEMDTNTVIKDNRVYAPVRYLAEGFNMDVTWDKDTDTIAIKYR